MNRNLIKLLCICLLCLIMCGCKASYDYDMEVFEDQTIGLNLHYHFDSTSIVSSVDKESISKQLTYICRRLEAAGFTTSYSFPNEDDARIYDLYLSGRAPIDEFISDSDEPYALHEFLEDRPFKYITKTRKMNQIVYEVNLSFRYGIVASETSSSPEYDETDEIPVIFYYAEDPEEDTFYQMFYPSLGNTFTVSLPNRVVSTNATTISEDGKTLDWDIEDYGINLIQYSFAVGNDPAVIYNDHFIELLSDQFNEGDEISFTVDDDISDDEIQIIDDHNQTIEFEHRDGKYYFRMPSGNVQIKLLKHMNNPETSSRIIFPILLILTILSISFVIKKKCL